VRQTETRPRKANVEYRDRLVLPRYTYTAPLNADHGNCKPVRDVLRVHNVTRIYSRRLLAPDTTAKRARIVMLYSASIQRLYNSRTD
jgi:hypothetical protein